MDPRALTASELTQPSVPDLEAEVVEDRAAVTPPAEPEEFALFEDLERPEIDASVVDGVVRDDEQTG